GARINPFGEGFVETAMLGLRLPVGDEADLGQRRLGLRVADTERSERGEKQRPVNKLHGAICPVGRDPPSIARPEAERNNRPLLYSSSSSRAQMQCSVKSM